jgi:hypothetical protein
LAHPNTEPIKPGWEASDWLECGRSAALSIAVLSASIGSWRFDSGISSAGMDTGSIDCETIEENARLSVVLSTLDSGEVTPAKVVWASPMLSSCVPTPLISSCIGSGSIGSIDTD